MTAAELHQLATVHALPRALTPAPPTDEERATVRAVAGIAGVSALGLLTVLAATVGGARLLLSRRAAR